ncbi:hypothetical protein [Streptomyces sp. NPDC047706]|uniref:hypothetical protein n=1 Tax=Streptomyces sp. NPDC047706 TaxID=3365486 RepID=UPI003719DE81
MILPAARRRSHHLPHGPSVSTPSEAPYVASKLVAPAGLIATREEKEEVRRATVGTALRRVTGGVAGTSVS